MDLGRPPASKNCSSVQLSPFRSWPHSRLRTEIPAVDHAGEPLAPRIAPDSAEVHELAAEMSSRWIAFARTGDPVCGELLILGKSVIRHTHFHVGNPGPVPDCGRRGFLQSAMSFFRTSVAFGKSAS